MPNGPNQIDSSHLFHLSTSSSSVDDDHHLIESIARLEQRVCPELFLLWYVHSRKDRTLLLLHSTSTSATLFLPCPLLCSLLLLSSCPPSIIFYFGQAPNESQLTRPSDNNDRRLGSHVLAREGFYVIRGRQEIVGHVIRFVFV